MFKKKDFSNPEGFDSLIGANSVFEGNVESEGVIRVDGKVKGDLKVNGDIYIGNTAVITGNITAENVHLAGTIEGNINAKGVLKILSTARLYGDIFVKSFVADEGGIFQGKCSMLDNAETAATKEKNTVKHPGKDYKKSPVISQIDHERDKNA